MNECLIINNCLFTAWSTLLLLTWTKTRNIFCFIATANSISVLHILMTMVNFLIIYEVYLLLFTTVKSISLLHICYSHSCTKTVPALSLHHLIHWAINSYIPMSLDLNGCSQWIINVRYWYVSPAFFLCLQIDWVCNKSDLVCNKSDYLVSMLHWKYIWYIISSPLNIYVGHCFCFVS